MVTGGVTRAVSVEAEVAGADARRGALCPRCGYDQAGAIAAWDRQSPACCPLDGRCTECGLVFAWRDLLNPGLARQHLMFEHAGTGLVRAFVRTLVRVFRPRALWDWVRMEHALVPARLVWFVGLGLILIAPLVGVALAAAPALASRIERRILGPYWGSVGHNDSFPLWQMTSWPSSLWTDSARNIPAPWIVVVLLAAALAPLAFLLLPTTLRRARVRRAHLGRVWAYGLLWMPVVLAGPVVLAVLAAAALAVDLKLHGKGYWLNGMGAWLRGHRYVPGLACGVVWLAAWWGIAARRYLRLPHSWAIGPAMALLAMLIGIGVVAVIPGGLTWLVWGL